jgi:glycosyltransferase involved in cell wall biosynthesis
MRIAFDEQIFLLQEYGGISRYICSLAKELAATPDVEARIYAPLHYNGHLQELSDPSKFAWRVPRINKTTRLVSGISRFVASQMIRALQPDVVHETYYSSYRTVPKKSAVVITVYDMIVERFPQMFTASESGTAQKHAAVNRADHVICISESTRQDLIEIFGFPEEKVSVVYLGFDDLSFDVGVPAPLDVPLMDRPYLLYVGGRGGYKNFAGFLRSYAASKFLRDELMVVCFGGGALTSDERALIADLQISQDQVLCMGGGDHVLASLYRDATAFVYPSRYEGFGIPPLEAMSLACPVICSDTSSIPEVVGDAGEYFDPENVDSMTHVIESVVQSTEKRNQLIRKGHERCDMFSWSRCAQETLSVYKGLM